MCLESVRCSCGVAVEGRLGRAYNEEAFKYFLAIERKRADRSRRSFLVLLINMKKQPGMRGRIGPVVARRIFSALCHGLREVDVIGWFREDRVVGAVLRSGAEVASPDVPSRIGHRIAEILNARVPASVVRRLHVRILQLRPGQ
jgi:hypothetical protein